MLYQLEFSAALDNIEKVTVPKDREVWVKLLCIRCRAESEPVEVDPSSEPMEIEGSPATAHLVMRCKECRTQGNISIVDEKIKLEFTGKAAFQPVLKLDCRNFEPIEFIPKSNTFSAVATESEAVFAEVDLTETEWYEYDEKEKRDVSITDVKYRFSQTR